MAFVNDYAKDGELERFKLREMWDKYLPRYKGNYWMGRVPDLTIDRDSNSYLMITGSGGEDTPNWKYFLLWLDGFEVKATVKHVPGGSTSFSDNPFRIIWDLVRLDFVSGGDERRDEVIATLRSALSVYGYRGIHRQVLNTLVEFRF